MAALACPTLGQAAAEEFNKIVKSVAMLHRVPCQVTQEIRQKNQAINHFQLRPYFWTYPWYAMTPKRESKRKFAMSTYI